MKFLFAGLLGIAFSLNTQAKTVTYPVHLDLEASSKMYRLEMSKQFGPWDLVTRSQEDADLQVIINAGLRNLNWLKFMNQHRDTPLTFTQPGSLKGIPIDKPMKYSGKILLQQYRDLIATFPQGMIDVIVDGKPFTENPPIADADYTKLGNKLDVTYQNTLRWQMMQPYLSWYSQNRVNDIRGYYFLNKEPDLQQTLAQWAQLPADRQAQLQEWLVGECYNSLESDQACADGFAANRDAGTLWDFHRKFVDVAKADFDDFFKIQLTREDFVWTSQNPNVGSLPFVTPDRNDIRDFLAVNIEDEWKWKDWQLKLNFQPQADVHVEFQPGVVPHVNGIAGNTITMDANTPLIEWDMQWTIRHEFGHVMGFPDCYIEFYDANEQAMISYQIDTTNLMCSRGGKFQESHFLELKKNYLKN